MQIKSLSIRYEAIYILFTDVLLIAVIHYLTKKENKAILPYLGKEKLVEPRVSSTRGSRWSHDIHNSEAEGDESCCLACFLHGVHKWRITLLQRKGNKENLYEVIRCNF